MEVRNFFQKEVLQGLYQAHGGGEAAMLFDDRTLEGILFLAQGILRPGKRIAEHLDPYEEIYYVLQGEAIMKVGEEAQRVKTGDATWIPHGSMHSMENDGEEDCSVLVIAAMPR